MSDPRYYDIRRVRGESTEIDIDNGRLENAGTSFYDHTVVRVLGPQGWGVLKVNGLDPDDPAGLREAIDAAMALAPIPADDVDLAPAPRGILDLPRPAEDPRDLSLEEKADLLSGIEAAARRCDGVTSTRARYIETVESVRFMDSSGDEYSYETVRSGFSILAVATRNGLMQAGRESFHTISGLPLRHREDLGVKAGERAAALLDARPVAGGRMNVVLDPELAGVFAHEAVGHASEGDLVREGASILRGRIGEQIGSPSVTIVDDPTMPEFGFEPVDAEGVAVTRTEIIREGRLVSYLHNRQTLAAVGDGLPGHARAAAGHAPLVRMSNTYIAPGDAGMEEILEGCGNGLLLAGSRGGQVDTGRGAFQFNAEYGYLVEDGEIGPMVRDLSLSGEILGTLHSIALVGRDLRMNQGYCGKGGQSLPVSDGAPHILLKDAVVGGSE